MRSPEPEVHYSSSLISPMIAGKVQSPLEIFVSSSGLRLATDAFMNGQPFPGCSCNDLVARRLTSLTASSILSSLQCSLHKSLPLSHVRFLYRFPAFVPREMLESNTVTLVMTN